MRIYDAHAKFCILSRDRRPSTLTAYLPVWHGDIRSFVTCRTARAANEDRVRHVFPALWIPDLLYATHILRLLDCDLTPCPSMQKLRDNADWYLFDPADAPDLNSTYGEQFAETYEQCMQTVKCVGKIRTNDLWRSICEAQTETGAPFIMYQDNVNRTPRPASPPLPFLTLL